MSRSQHQPSPEDLVIASPKTIEPSTMSRGMSRIASTAVDAATTTCTSVAAPIISVIAQ